MKAKETNPKRDHQSETKDPTETKLPSGGKGKNTSKENADHTGTDTDSDATQRDNDALKPERFGKNRRETDPDMTEQDGDPDSTEGPARPGL